MTTTSEPAGPVEPEDLRRMRLEVGLTQRELAGKVGCSIAWIANAEGAYIPKYSPTLRRVLAVLRKAGTA